MSQKTNALFIIFGATGDLASKKLFPALYNLYSKGYLSENFSVIGTARREWSDDYFQKVVMNAIKDITTAEDKGKSFAEHFYYKSHNVKDTDHYEELKRLADQLDKKYSIGGNRIFYLSMAPNLFGVITDYLNSENLATKNGFNRVIIEKPFGYDYISSKELNDEITEAFDADQLYRIDHYLGKEMVQNILALRFSNPLFSTIWNKNAISNIQITLNENFGVQERGGYYDKNGALKDMVQNHILQIFSLLTMEEPETFNSEEVLKEKVKALKSIKPIGDSEIKNSIVRGQYVAPADHSELVSYRDEEKVDNNSNTETFVAGKIEVNNPRFEGVPFYYRTGKQLAEKTSRIDVVFKGNSNNLFDEEKASKNILTINLDSSQGITLSLNQKETGHDMIIKSTQLTEAETENTNIPEAYEVLIQDALTGNQTNFAHYEEVAESWKYVDNIENTWKNDSSGFTSYEIGSMGPDKANELLEKHNHHWVYNG